jgi:hypothetical protein
MDQAPPYAHDQLWLVNADGSAEHALVQHDPATDPDWELCSFGDIQFSSDSRLVYFLAHGTGFGIGNPLYVYDLTTGKRRLITAAWRLFVLQQCAIAEYVDFLVVAQHDYFLFGGSYDWWWLVDPDGVRVGPIGPEPSGLEYECKVKLPLEQVPYVRTP